MSQEGKKEKTLGETRQDLCLVGQLFKWHYVGGRVEREFQNVSYQFLQAVQPA